MVIIKSYEEWKKEKINFWLFTGIILNIIIAGSLFLILNSEMNDESMIVMSGILLVFTIVFSFLFSINIKITKDDSLGRLEQYEQYVKEQQNMKKNQDEYERKRKELLKKYKNE